MKKLALIITGLSVLLFVLGGHLYYQSTGDFRLSYLLESEGSEKIGDPEGLKSILNQEFYYLGQGHQTFAFGSGDGRYVLKLFKKDYLKSSGWLNVLPPIPPFRNFFLHAGKSKLQRKEKLLRGYAAALEYDKDNSGLAYYHPASTEGVFLKASLVSPIGTLQAIDLNHYVFAIQVRVRTTKNELHHLLSQGKVNEAKERLHQLLMLYLSSYQNGIFDHDHNIFDNTGFYGNRAIRQDIGKVVYDPQFLTESFIFEDLKKIREKRITPWLKKNYPNAAPELLESAAF